MSIVEGIHIGRDIGYEKQDFLRFEGKSSLNLIWDAFIFHGTADKDCMLSAGKWRKTEKKTVKGNVTAAGF